VQAKGLFGRKERKETQENVKNPAWEMFRFFESENTSI
jgi:hypothetical protein